jgi:hypothetical protein
MVTLKGAFLNLGAGLLGALPNIVVFQFNPDRVSRTPTLAQPPARPVGAGARDATQQASGPTESYSFMLRLDATDQLAQASVVAAANGILPALSALELLMMPTSRMSIDLFGLAGKKTAPYANPPTRLPTVLFFWGPFRIWPVTVNSLSVNELQYDQLLNPVRAEINVTLQVLTENQIKDAPLALGAYRYSFGVKQVMAALNFANAAKLDASASLSLIL